MTESTHPDEPLVASLIAQLRQMREAERDLFGALDSMVRDAPMRPGDWSPKDHQAHLTAWKARQADRIEAMRGGHAYPTDDRETDEINAELQATRADWPWGRIVAEADQVSSRLEAEIRAAGSALLLESGRLVGGIFGNGPFHAATHFGWLADAGIGLDEARLAAFIETEEELLNATALPDSDRGPGCTTSPVCMRWPGASTVRARSCMTRSACGRTWLSTRSVTPTSRPWPRSCPRSRGERVRAQALADSRVDVIARGRPNPRLLILLGMSGAGINAGCAITCRWESPRGAGRPVSVAGHQPPR